MSNVRRFRIISRGLKVHLYLRLLKPVLDYSDEEKVALTEVMTQAPGMVRVKRVERHSKGGYAITMDFERESLDALIEYLTSNGLQAVF